MFFAIFTTSMMVNILNYIDGFHFDILIDEELMENENGLLNQTLTQHLPNNPVHMFS